MTVEARSIEDFLRTSILRAQKLWSRLGGKQRVFQFGHVRLTVRFIAGHAQDVVCPVIEHAEHPDDDEMPDAVVYVLVSDQTGLAAPPDHWPFPDETIQDHQRICWRPEDGLALSSDDGRGIWHLFDLASMTGLYWLNSVESLPYWEFGSPLRHFIHWACLKSDVAMIHGAVIGRDQRGIMLTGAGGSGKSTMTAAAISRGWQTTGDDFVLVSMPPKVTSFPIFDVMKLTGMAEDMFADQVAMATNRSRKKGEKALIPVSGAAGPNFVSRLPIDAVFSLRLTGAETSHIETLSKVDAVAALAPSTMNILRTAMPETLKHCSLLARALPTYKLLVGTNPLEGLSVLQAFLQQQDNS